MKLVCNTPDCKFCDEDICTRDTATLYNGECVSMKERHTGLFDDDEED